MDISLMIDNIKFNYRVALLIENTNSILVECSPGIDFFTLPGGRVKTMESSIDALIREISEEMNIDIKEYDIKFSSLIESFFEFDNTKYHEVYILYRLKISDEDERFKDGMKNKDSRENYYKWILKDKLNEVYLLPDVLKNIVIDDSLKSFVVNDLK